MHGRDGWLVGFLGYIFTYLVVVYPGMDASKRECMDGMELVAEFFVRIK